MSLNHKGFVNFISSDLDILFEEKKDLTLYTTMKLFSTGSLVTVKSVSALKKVVNYFFEEKINYLIIGSGANVVLESEMKTILLHLDFKFDKSALESPQEYYSLPASISLSKLTSHAVKFGLKGWEVFTGIPASLGGAIFMNAGTSLGEISEVVDAVHVLRMNGKVEIVKIVENRKELFCYRGNNFINPGDIIFQVDLIHKGLDPKISKKIKEYLLNRRETQPLSKSTCGCVFKNGKEHTRYNSGHLIDLLGLKGFTSGSLKISNQHANFIENMDRSDLNTFNELISTIEEEINLSFGVKLNREVQFLK